MPPAAAQGGVQEASSGSTSRPKRAAEVPLEDMPENAERGDAAADAPGPVDMEDLVAAAEPPKASGAAAAVQSPTVYWSPTLGRYATALALDVAALELVENGEISESKAGLYQLVAEQVSSHWTNMGCDIKDYEVADIATRALQLGAVDLAEVYSPHRFSARASEFQLRPGFVTDLEELMHDGQSGDLTTDEDVKELGGIQEEQDPILLTGSPPTEVFSALRNLSGKCRGEDEQAADLATTGRYLEAAAGAYKRQVTKEDRYFLHEHPWMCRSWQEPAIRELMAMEGVFTVKGPTCRWVARTTDPRTAHPKEAFVRDEAGWLTNHPGLARRLEGFSRSQDRTQEWHRHVDIVGGIVKFSKIHPPKLVSAVLDRGRYLRSRPFQMEIGRCSGTTSTADTLTRTRSEQLAR